MATALPRPRLGLATYLRLGARNLWRNPQRTLLSLLTIVAATAVVTFLEAVNDGWMNDLRNNFIHSYNSHLQIRAASARGQGSEVIHDPAAILEALADQPGVAAWAPRLEADGLAAVAGANVGVRIIGVMPERERRVSRLRHMLVGGQCFAPDAEHRVVLGYQVARILGVEPRDRVVLTSQTPAGELRAGLFTLCGVIRSGSPQIDRLFALMPMETARDWLGTPGGVTHVAVRATGHERVAAVAAGLRQALAGKHIKVMSWQEIDPMVGQWLRFSDAYGLMILAIVVALAIAQVSNTMVMSVYGRLPEFGLMQALGTRSGQLYAMVAFEAMMLVILGGALGYGAGAAAVALSAGGIDFSALAGAFEFFFMEPVIHPRLTHETATRVAVALATAGVLGALYPAWRAARLDPLEAMA